MRKILTFLTVLFAIFMLSQFSWAQETTMLIHIKTDLDEDDAQICVAYNVIWAAIESGSKVNVLIDASAVNTYKKGWRGKDSLEGYKLPEKLREGLSNQFNVALNSIPKTYGEYLDLLHKKGATFYINGAMLVVAGISESYGDMSRFSTDFFTPVTLQEMVNLMKEADYYFVY